MSKGKLFLKTISNVFVPLSSALIASGLLAGIQSILVSLTSTGALESTATVQSIITILRILKAGVLSYLVIHVGVNAAREFKTDINLGGALGAVVLLTGMSADNPLVNIITGEPLKSGQGGVIGVVAAVWVLAKIRKFISKRMPEALDLVLSSFIALTLTGLITLFFIMAGGRPDFGRQPDLCHQAARNQAVWSPALFCLHLVAHRHVRPASFHDPHPHRAH